MSKKIEFGWLYEGSVIRWVIVCCIVVGVFFRPITLIAFVIAAVWAFKESSLSELFITLFFLMPYAAIFKYVNGSSSLFTYLELIIVVKLLVRQKYSRSFVVAWLLFSGYVILGMGSEVNTAIKQICMPVLIYNCLQDDRLQNFTKCIGAYCSSVFFSSIFGMFKGSLPALAELVNSKQTRMSATEMIYADRFSGLWGDPNYYSVNILLCLGLIIYLHIKGLIKPLWAILGYVIIGIFGAMTGSKSFILVFVIILVLFFFELIKSGRIVLAGIMLIGCIGLVFLILSGKIAIFDTVIARLLSAKSADELTTERSTLWLMYLNNFIEHPFKALIGVGVGGEYSFYNAPHNTYIDFIEVYGVVGTAIFTCCMLFACRMKIREKRIINNIPLIILLIMYFSLSMITYLDLPFQLMLAIMAIYYVHPCDEFIITDEYAV